MWLAILSPGAHPSRATPTDDSTVYCWTPRERVRIDGPAFAVHGGLRMLRRRYGHVAAGLVPRCFACREPCAVPDAQALRADPDVPLLGERPGPPSAPPERDVPGGVPAAALAFVHLEDLTDDEDPPLTEEALVVVPERRLALFVPLLALPDLLTVVAQVADPSAAPCCERCGRDLPGRVREAGAPAPSRAQRRAAARCRGDRAA